MAKRNRVVYVTADQADWVVIDFPFGLIPPPILELHRPMAGAVQFFFAECYRLPIPGEALAAAAGDDADPAAHPVTSRCECGGLARHIKKCRWRQGYGSHVIGPAPEGEKP